MNFAPGPLLVLDLLVLTGAVGAFAWLYLLLFARATARTRRFVVRGAMAAMIGLPWLLLMPARPAAFALAESWQPLFAAPTVADEALVMTTRVARLHAPGDELRANATVGAWARGFLLVWCAVGLLLAARELRAWLRLRVVLRRARPADPAALRLLHELEETPAGVALRRAPGVRGPFAVGAWRPCVVLPEEAPVDGRLRRVLAHELAHVRHRDLPWHAVAAGLRILFWFQPLAWWLAVEHERIAEELADAAALRADADGEAYARDLLLCAESGAGVGVGGYGFLRRRSELRRRIEHIFSPRMKTTHQFHLRSALPGVAFLAGAVVVGLLFTGHASELRAAISVAAADANNELKQTFERALRLPAAEGRPILAELVNKHLNTPYLVYWLAVRELDTGDTAAARARFEELVGQRPKGWVTTWSAVRLFQIAHFAGDATAAEAWVRRASELNRTHGDGGQSIAVFMEALLNPRPSRAEVEPQLQAALKAPAVDRLGALQALRAKYPRDLYVTYWLGVHLTFENRSEQARPLFQEVADQGVPNWVTAWATMQLARLEKRAGRAAEADTLARRAVRLAEQHGNGGESIAAAARSEGFRLDG